MLVLFKLFQHRPYEALLHTNWYHALYVNQPITVPTPHNCYLPFSWGWAFSCLFLLETLSVQSPSETPVQSVSVELQLSPQTLMELSHSLFSFD